MLSLRAGLALKYLKCASGSRYELHSVLSGNFLPEGARALVWQLGKVA
jgi:hypothetical protein